MRGLLIAGVLLVLAGCDLGDGEDTTPTTSASPNATSTSTEARLDLGPLTPAVARQAVMIHLRQEGPKAAEAVTCKATDDATRMRCDIEFEHGCNQLDVFPNPDGTVAVRQPDFVLCVYDTVVRE